MKTYAIPRHVLAEAWQRYTRTPPPSTVATSHVEAKAWMEFDMFRSGFAYGFLTARHLPPESSVVFADEFTDLGRIHRPSSPVEGILSAV